MKSLRTCSPAWLILLTTFLSGGALSAPSSSPKEDRWNNIETIGPDDLKQYINEHGSMIADNATYADYLPSCATQKPRIANNSSALAELTNEAIYVGQDRISRWSQGSSVFWCPSPMGFPSIKDAWYAAEALVKAADEWNAKGIGARFKHTDNCAGADFVLLYGGAPPGDEKTIAIAFFPTNQRSDLKVFKRAFDADTKPLMWKYLLHELGHVLGLRHEFAMDVGETYEGGAIRIGTRNALSVMNYYQKGGPEIQPSDVYYTKQFYNYPEGIMLDGHELKIYKPGH